MNRKQKAMEERFQVQHPKTEYIARHSRCPEIDFETALRKVQWGIDRGEGELKALRKHFDYTYKNGAKTFDKAYFLLTSPLMEALA